MRQRFATSVALIGLLGSLVVACSSDDEADEPETSAPAPAPVPTSGGSASTAAPPSTLPEEEPVAGGSITALDSGALPATFDPATNAFSRVGPNPGTQALAMTSVYDTLIRIDYNTNEIIPRLAERVESSADATTWTITLRSGVEFSDGTPYDSAAVKANWERAKDPALASRCRSAVSSFTAVETPDPQTIEVTLAAPAAGFPWLLQGCLSAVASPAALQQFGDSYGTSPDTTVGAGPFRLDEFVANDHATLKRNPGFWDSPRPYLDSLTIKAPPTQSQALDALLSGTVDMAVFQNGTLGTDYQRFLDAPGIVRHSYGPVAGATSYAFNTNRTALDDVRVRRALVMAFDPEDFNQKVGGGALEMADTYLSEDSAFHNPDVAQPSNRLADAQALIDEYVAEHGPVQVEITTSTSVATWNVAVQQQWSRLKGVTVTISADTDQSAGPKLATGDYQVAAFNLGTDIDPETLYNRYHSTSSQNVLKFADPKMDELLTEYRGELDPVKQQALLDEITAFLVDQAWIMQAHRVTAYTATTERVKGEISWRSPGHIDPSTLWLER